MFPKLSTHLKRTLYLPFLKMKAPRRMRMKGLRPWCRNRHLSRNRTCVTQPVKVGQCMVRCSVYRYKVSSNHQFPLQITTKNQSRSVHDEMLGIPIQSQFKSPVSFSDNNRIKVGQCMMRCSVYQYKVSSNHQFPLRITTESK